LSCATACKPPLAFLVPLVLNGGLAPADVTLDEVAGAVHLSSGTVCRLSHAHGVQLVVLVGVTAANVAADAELDVLAGVVRLVV